MGFLPASALGWFFFVFCALPQSFSQTSEGPKTFPVTGTVVNSITGRPIARVLVRIDSNRAMLTGPEGEFAFNNVPAGTTEITVNKPGYFRPEAVSTSYTGYRPIAMSYKVDVGPDLGPVTFKLSPTAMITGSVEGNNEEPLEGVQVTVYAARVVEGRRQLIPSRRSTTTDEDGNFRMVDLVPGRYYLSAKAGRAARSILGQSENGGQAYPAVVYFPSGTDVANAAPLDLTAGDHQEVHFTLKLVPSFKVAGTVFKPGAWKQLNSPILMDDFQQALFATDRFDRQSGVFEFRTVPAGTYWLQVAGMNQEGQYMSSFRKVQVESNLLNLRFTAQPGLDIPIILQTNFVHENSARGHCRYTTDSGDVHDSDCSDYPSARVELRSLDLPRLRFQSDTGPLKAAFSVRGVAPGKYSVRVMATFGGYIQSVHCGGLDLMRDPLVVPEDGSIPPIEVVVRDDPATLTIKVRTDKPGRETTVLVFPDPVTVTEPQLRTSSQGGEVYAGQLPPGAYKIFAFDATENFDYSSLEELEKYSSQATRVKVEPNENTSVVVDLIHIGE